MSKLLKLVNAKTTGKRKLLPVELNYISDIVEIQESYVKVRYGIEYIIGAQFGSKAFVAEESSEALSFTVENVKQSIVEAVFGEFRIDFRKLNEAVYKHDLDAIREHLIEFEHRMFHE